ncbi:hypothetical protein APB26_33010 [Pseudomonas aeruginosa]|nr:hypothetical protein APB26_33010 [Pseudomonas aeruginosa]RPV61476.1 hypothetical protein IPC838_19355 [Pseudomonas aeruginosa]
MLAGVCGFGSWDVMTYAIGSMPPSPRDEELVPSEYQERLAGQLRILVQDHDLDPASAIHLLVALPPTSGKAFSSFDPDEPYLYKAEHLLVLRNFAVECSRELENLVPDFFDASVNLQGLSLADPVRADIAIALSGRTEPEAWLYILEALGWQYDFSEDGHPDLDEPSFTVFDPVLGDVPVYLSPLTKAPVFDAEIQVDRGHRVQRALCVGDFTSHWKNRSTVALLLHRWPVVREVDDQVFCHLGSVFNAKSNSWRDLLFTLGTNCLHELIELNVAATGFPDRWPGLADSDENLSQLACICLSGFDPFEEDESPDNELLGVRIPIGETGWMIQKLMDPDDEDE